MFSRRSLPLVLAVPALALAGCAGPDGTDDDGRPAVLASIAPLEFLVTEIGGDLVHVRTMTPAGTDPHTVELSPRQLRDVGDADLVVYLRGFQPAVDDAVAERAGGRALDVGEAVDLRPLPHDATEDDHDEDADDHDHGGVDPHFWLDPERFATAARAVGEALGAADPAGAATYAANAEALAAELADLDDAFATGLADCASDVVVTSHAAFGYLTERYGLRQVAVLGLDPEREPSPARIRQVREAVADLGATAVFTEPLAEPSVAETIAEDLQVSVLELDPLDTRRDDGPDYRDAMAANLEALRTGLVCR